ncbi:unnamed protein product [Miscanthus lutarioriparius]|uniref:SMP domain-containing protein n=1 Tax=Miscanthus lutarioriparius TaxID=422564 RepID=A0A811MG79_9POAL|nr:unnamed protein product [Miscanthus lutarioriparius]
MTDVLTWEATMKLPTGKAVTSEVAAAVAEAEAANYPERRRTPWRVAPRDATESVTEQLAHGGSGDGVIDETYDTRVKIGEALEGSARAIGDKPVERSDAKAIRVAEASALGGDAERWAIPGGVAERAQAAAAANARASRDEDKVTMTDVLTWEATMKLPTGKAVTSEVAAAVAEAEAANYPRAETNPRGVSAALDMAAKHNLNTSAPLE